MITYRNLCKYAFSLVMVMFIGISTANGQTLTDYAKKHKAELAEKQKIEKEAYDAACIKGTMEALNTFVNNYPKSKYASEAKSKIRSLEQKIEKDAYDSACKTSTLDAFRGFLKKYPQSQYAQDVQNRIKDFDLWSIAKKNNTIQAYNSYLENSQYKTFAAEAKAAIQDINAVSEWQNVKSTSSLAEVQAYINKYPNASSISDARKKEHELKGVQFYNSGNLASAYREFTDAGGKYAIAYANRAAYDKCQEYHDFSLLSSYSKESELTEFLKKYPNSEYGNNVSNWIAIAKAKDFTMYSGEYTYKSALSYAKDETTRNQVKGYYEARQREYSQYKKDQRRAKRRRDGGIVNFGIEISDIAFNPAVYSDDDYDIDYVMYYNVGLGIKLGNYKSPIQFEVGAKPGLTLYTLWYGYEDETKTSFHLPLYARLKIGLGGGNYSKWYIDGIGYYNILKDSFLEGDYSVSAGLGVSWRHWDWRILYYKQDIGTKYTYADYKFLGTSFSYYF